MHRSCGSDAYALLGRGAFCKPAKVCCEAYGHNNDNLVTVGQRVTAGEEIATVGNRGISTGPHLHFEVDTPAGNKVDPRLWLAERGATITGSDRDS